MFQKLSIDAEETTCFGRSLFQLLGRVGAVLEYTFANINWSALAERRMNLDCFWYLTSVFVVYLSELGEQHEPQDSVHVLGITLM